MNNLEDPIVYQVDEVFDLNDDDSPVFSLEEKFISLGISVFGF
jgi:hypothetical protein